jgi:shikimate kinase / 3-dehydroquinate synthase
MADIVEQKNGGGGASGTEIVARLGHRSIVLIGMMGVGKSSIGRRLGARLGIPFVDADAEIEKAAGMSIADIFARHGEAAFRSGESRVIARLLDGGPQVLATGGGAVMNPDTRALIKEKGVSIWLSADFDLLMRRTSKRKAERPMLHTADPVATLRALLAEREPIYAQADLTVQSREIPHDAVVSEIIGALTTFLATPARGRSMTAPVRDQSAVVPVSLGARSYDIIIGRGIIGSLGTRIAALRPGAKTFVVSDDNVAGHTMAAAEAALARAGLATNHMIVAPGEVSKSYRVFEKVCEAILKAQIERDDLIIALGGGVVGDLAGFAAAVVRRGLDYVQVPTTLLAQVDSSVGGKTAIDSNQGKNLIGAFHQPILVLADTALLDTLPQREFRAGYAELVKFGLLGDAAFFDWLDANWREIFAGNSPGSFAREHAVTVACRAKAAIVGRDERDTGERALLNLGHTFGHALEAGCGFSERLLHGEAIAVGMALAFDFSARQGLLPAAEAERVRRHLAAVGLPTRLSDIPGPLPGVDRMMELIAQDKKVKRGMLTFILVRAIGSAFVETGVEERKVRAFLSEKLAGR